MEEAWEKRETIGRGGKALLQRTKHLILDDSCWSTGDFHTCEISCRTLERLFFGKGDMSASCSSSESNHEKYILQNTKLEKGSETHVALKQYPGASGFPWDHVFNSRSRQRWKMDSSTNQFKSGAAFSRFSFRGAVFALLLLWVS